MIAYKFLDQGRLAPFTRVEWPLPGEWLESERVELCASGVHACRIRDLPYWLRAELWEAELEGDLVDGERLVAAARGRLVRRIETWTPEMAKAFGRSCAEEARRRVAAGPDLEEYAADAEGTAGHSPQFAAFATARLAELQEGTAGYEAERARQARWLGDTLQLS
jgi:hypothetical protein